jgi:hypothetical protein
MNNGTLLERNVKSMFLLIEYLKYCVFVVIALKNKIKNEHGSNLKGYKFSIVLNSIHYKYMSFDRYG